jgi:uncharacterized membrane protein YqiK
MRLLLATICVTLLVGCSTVKPDAGHEGVLIRKPMFFGSGGVATTPVKTGLKYVAWTTSAEIVNMQPARVDAVFDDLMTSDGVPIDFHAVVSYRITDSVKMVRDYGADFNEGGSPGFWIRNRCAHSDHGCHAGAGQSARRHQESARRDGRAGTAC